MRHGSASPPRRAASHSTSNLACPPLVVASSSGTGASLWTELVDESNEDVNWFRAMKAATVTADGHVLLGGGVSWPDMKSPLLFVRHFYAPCWDSVMAKGEPKDPSLPRQFVVMGTPGIGKSAFGFYILWRALKEGKTVIYKTRKRMGTTFLFRDGKLFTVSSPAYINEMTYRATILIVDGEEPPSVAAFTVLITSPLRARWKEFVKPEGVEQLVFPVFPRDEMLKLRTCAFSAKAGCDEPAVIDRYAKWGGSVRHVLTHPEDSWQMALYNGAAKMSLEYLKASFGTAAKDRAAEAQHNVLHLKAVCELEGSKLLPSDLNFYRFSHGELASQYVHGLVYKQLRANEAENLFAFLRTSEATPAVAGFRGKQFEHFALGALVEGGSFKLKQLRRDGDPVLSGSLTACGPRLELARSSMNTFGTLADVSLDAPSVWKPKSNIFCAIDGVVVCAARRVLAVNATVSLSHPLHLTNERGGLDSLATTLAFPQGEIPFLWLVPEDIFDEMNAPSPLQVNKKVLKPAELRSHIVGKRVVQYAVCIPIPGPGGGSGAVNHTR